MDIVYIQALELDAVIGVYEWERQVEQRLLLDLELGVDNKKAAVSDNLDDALDYFQISQRVRAFVVEQRVQLVETLAERIAQLLQNEFSVPWVKVKLAKPGAVSFAADVGVVIERGDRTLKGDGALGSVRT